MIDGCWAQQKQFCCFEQSERRCVAIPIVPKNADALAVVTEWNEFLQLDLEKLKKILKRPVLFDGRNIYDPAKLRQLGFVYYGVGRI